jgi:hypothetical protein
MKLPPIVTPLEWQAAREALLVKEKEHTRARDALAAERRRMPWMAVEKQYEFDGPNGGQALPTSSRAVTSSSSTARSMPRTSRPTRRAAHTRNEHASAAPWLRTRSRTPPI